MARERETYAVRHNEDAFVGANANFETDIEADESEASRAALKSFDSSIFGESVQTKTQETETKTGTEKRSSPRTSCKRKRSCSD